jgi:hypothetical protein
MLILGLCYTAGFIGILGLSNFIDGGEFIKLSLGETHLDDLSTITPELQNAFWFTTILNLLLSSIFWYAPALVHWHSLPAIKSLFFSTVAFISNWRAFLVFGLAWLMVSGATASTLLLIGSLLDNFEFAATAMIPAMLMISAMFFCSTYFSFKDSFISDTLYA